MSDRPDLAQMGEAELREWLGRLPAQELVEVIVSYVRAFLRDGIDEFGGAAGGMGQLLEMSFAEIITYLKENTRLPELSRMRVDGDVVKFQTAAGSDVSLTATGLQDGPGLPGLGGRGGFARSTPDPAARAPRARPNAGGGPAPAPASRPEGEAAEDGPVARPATPRRLGGLFGGGGSGTGESRGGPSRSGGGPKRSGGPPGRPAQPPRARPDKAGAKKKKDSGPSGSGRFSMLEFD